MQVRLFSKCKEYHNRKNRDWCLSLYLYDIATGSETGNDIATGSATAVTD